MDASRPLKLNGDGHIDSVEKINKTSSPSRRQGDLPASPRRRPPRSGSPRAALAELPGRRGPSSPARGLLRGPMTVPAARPSTSEAGRAACPTRGPRALTCRRALLRSPAPAQCRLTHPPTHARVSSTKRRARAPPPPAAPPRRPPRRRPASLFTSATAAAQPALALAPRGVRSRRRRGSPPRARARPAPCASPYYRTRASARPRRRWHQCLPHHHTHTHHHHTSGGSHSDVNERGSTADCSLQLPPGRPHHARGRQAQAGGRDPPTPTHPTPQPPAPASRDSRMRRPPRPGAGAARADAARTARAGAGVRGGGWRGRRSASASASATAAATTTPTAGRSGLRPDGGWGGRGARRLAATARAAARRGEGPGARRRPRQRQGPRRPCRP